MYQCRESKLTMRRKFESRVWKKEETFHEYLHDKIIMGNRVPIDEDEVLDHIIDGISDTILRDQARIQGFASTDSLLKAFEKITLRDRNVTSMIRQDKRSGGDDRRGRIGGADGESSGRRSDNSRGKLTNIRRCYNCRAREHISADCPNKDLGAKCFECGKFGHIAAKCPKRNSETKKTILASTARIPCKKYMKDVSIDGQIVTALIDTGSDISIMRASEHTMIGSPRLRASETEFCGVGGYRATASGEFRAQIEIDGYTYPILIRVVADTVLQYGLLLGADFLNTVELSFKGAVISINPLITEETIDDEARPEIFAIDVQSVSAMDTPDVQDANHRNIITNLVKNYRPNKTKEASVNHMTIILKDDVPIYQKARRLA